MPAEIVGQTVVGEVVLTPSKPSSLESARSPEKMTLPSSESTRTNSPADSVNASEDEDFTNTLHKQGVSDNSHFHGTLGLRRCVRAAILKDLGVEIESEPNSIATPTTAAGSPSTLSVSSHGPLSQMPCTPTSSISLSPAHIMTTRPAAARSPKLSTFCDASQRSPALADASHRSPATPSTRLYDASRRSPNLSPGVGYASQRTLGAKQTINRGIVQNSSIMSKRLIGGDASQRSAPMRSYNLGVASWGAASASITATREAALSSTAEEGVPKPRAPVTGETAAVNMSDPTQSLKCWLSGISCDAMPCGEDLAARLQAALPETYED